LNNFKFFSPINNFPASPPQQIKYLAGSNGDHLSPIYMNALDNELIGAIHRQTANMSRTDANMTLELIFYILNK
jgi:MAD (mothers against decapentaplegic) interacting protein